jgi:tripartite ATP-independent transporter DctP family solute receptor
MATVRISTIAAALQTSLIVCTVAALSGCAVPSASSVIQLKLAHVSSPGSMGAVSAEDFARRVNETLAGRVHMSVFGSGQLGTDEVLMIKLRLGTVDFAAPATVISSVVEGFGFWEMPYLVKDRAHLKRIEEEIFWPRIEPLAQQRGYKVLALWEHGFRQITNNVRPIVTPADLRGIKLRTPKGYWRVRLFQGFGAHPSPMSLGEVFVAIQTGVLDGQENPLQQIYASRFQEVQKYLSLTNHVYSPVFLTAGSEKFAKLPPDIQSTLVRLARETQQYTYDVAGKMDQDIMAELAKSRIQTNESNRESFLDASKAIYEQFSQEVPGARDWIERALALEPD